MAAWTESDAAQQDRGEAVKARHGDRQLERAEGGRGQGRAGEGEEHGDRGQGERQSNKRPPERVGPGKACQPVCPQNQQPGQQVGEPGCIGQEDQGQDKGYRQQDLHPGVQAVEEAGVILVVVEEVDMH